MVEHVTRNQGSPAEGTKRAGLLPPFLWCSENRNLAGLLHFLAARTFARVLADGVAFALWSARAYILAIGLKGSFFCPSFSLQLGLAILNLCPFCLDHVFAAGTLAGIPRHGVTVA